MNTQNLLDQPERAADQVEQIFAAIAHRLSLEFDYMNAFLDRFGGANMLDMIRAEIGSPIDHDSGLD